MTNSLGTTNVLGTYYFCILIQKLPLIHFHFLGLWQGLGPRIVMVGTLTAAQWFIYDAVKVFFRLPRPPPPEMPESLKKKLALQ